MSGNHVLIDQMTLASATSSIVFDNIPQSGYTDLKLVFSARCTATNGGYQVYGVLLSINGSTSDFSSKALAGETAAFSYTDVPRQVGWMPDAGATANTYSNSELYIANYLSTATKSWSINAASETNSNGGAYRAFIGGAWANTAKIHTVTLSAEAGNFAAGSSFSLYGIAAVGATPTVTPLASGGDIVTNDGTYWYHAFTSTGVFVPSKPIVADVLVVAGGGAGGYGYAGGGGAGGLLAFTSQPLTTSTSYTCTVGAGGASTAGSYGAGFNGGNSQFGALTPASVGGGGGGSQSNPGKTGGSGGGNGSSGGGGGYTSGQGNAGGNGTYDGGGGIGGAGSGGFGGAGTSSYSSWGALTYTGVSINGTRWYAAGGNGETQSDTTYGRTAGWAAANPSTGCGGGGNNNPSNAVGGGSGIIMIRYPMA